MNRMIESPLLVNLDRLTNLVYHLDALTRVDVIRSDILYLDNFFTKIEQPSAIDPIFNKEIEELKNKFIYFKEKKLPFLERLEHIDNFDDLINFLRNDLISNGVFASMVVNAEGTITWIQYIRDNTKKLVKNHLFTIVNIVRGFY